MKISFSATAKEEMLRQPPQAGQPEAQHPACCRRAELSGLAASSGTLTLGRKGIGFKMVSRQGAVVRHALQLIKRLYALEPEIQLNRGTGAQANAYVLSLAPGEAEDMLCDLTLIQRDPEGFWTLPGGIDRALTARACCRRAYLRGAFLGAGSVSDPRRGYHLEIAVQDKAYAEALRRLMVRLKLPARIAEKKSAFVVYLKDGEVIERALVLLGAHGAMLDMGNQRILKDVRNNVNRAVNCESANIEKTMDAAQRQRAAIERLKQRGRWDTLPEELRELGELRLNHPEATLIELGQMLVKPVGKSGVNHRLRRIEAMAQENVREGKG